MDIDTKQLPQKLQQEIIMTFQGCKPQGHLRLGLGSSEKVGQVAKTLVETGPVLLMATPSMKRLGVAQKLQALLEQAKLLATTDESIHRYPAGTEGGGHAACGQSGEGKAVYTGGWPWWRQRAGYGQNDSAVCHQCV